MRLMRNERRHTSITAIRREMQDKKRTYILSISAVILIISACILFNLNISAHGNRIEAPVNFTYYKSITIQSGDTLWNIAEKYMVEEYESVSEYVAALKEMNSLYTDNIHSGQHLMVAYSDTEFVK